MVTVRAVLIAGLSVAAAADGARAGLVYFFDVVPEHPTTETPVSVTAWTWFHDTGHEVVDATYSITGNQILMDVIIRELGAGFQAITAFGGTVDLGLLAEGAYEVNATTYEIPYPGLGEPPGDPEFHSSGETSFDVVPEPGTFGLLVLGGLALVMTRRKPATA